MDRENEGEEHGGEEMGYRTPLAERQEGTAAATEKAPVEGEEGAAGPGDEEGDIAPAEEVEVDEETFMDLTVEDVDLLIDQQDLSVDKGLEEEEKKIEVAKALGYEVVIEEGEGLPGPEGTLEGLQGQISELNRELAMLRPAQELMRVLEEDPDSALQDLAEYYGVTTPTPATAAATPAAPAAVEIPAEEPRPNETMPQYLARLMQAGFASMQANLAAAPAAAPAAKARPGARKPHPQVVATLKYLDKNYPDWVQHEKKMLELVQVNPALMNDPDALYEKATGRKGGPQARAKAKARKITLKKAGATGERGGRAALKLARKGTKLDPQSGTDFAKAWDIAKRQVHERGS